jgi:pyrimidine-nucleoside phosphorylase/thymidine phosphorylase
VSFTESIARKRDGEALARAEIAQFVRGATDGSLPAEQLAAMLMAICVRGMDASETRWLTEDMLASGEQWSIRDVVPQALDKHSTGGVGDTVSLVFVPLMAAVGVPVTMMAGRGLGHSQGTLDKLEAIPGFRVDFGRDDLLRVLDEGGAAIIAQTEAIAPADRRLYALRDVTATVPSLPLIVGSIMSKKLALGAGALILDVKCGSGAFRKTLAEADELARALRSVARAADVACEAVITGMDQPLGPSLGTACEVREALAVLSGGGSEDLRRVTLVLAEEALVLSGRRRESARLDLEGALANGDALRAWERLVRAHGGDPNPERLPAPRRTCEVICERSGSVASIDGEALGRVAVDVGAGRRRRDEPLDHRAGVEVAVRLGESVARGQPLARLLLGERVVDEADLALEVARAFVVADEAPSPAPLIHGTPEHLRGSTGAGPMCVTVQPQEER